MRIFCKEDSFFFIMAKRKAREIRISHCRRVPSVFMLSCAGVYIRLNKGTKIACLLFDLGYRNWRRVFLVERRVKEGRVFCPCSLERRYHLFSARVADNFFIDMIFLTRLWNDFATGKANWFSVTLGFLLWHKSPLRLSFLVSPEFRRTLK